MDFRVTQPVGNCPTCGCPITIQARHLGLQVHCGHCRAQFTVHGNGTGALAITSLVGSQLMARVNRFLNPGSMPDAVPDATTRNSRSRRDHLHAPRLHQDYGGRLSGVSTSSRISRLSKKLLLGKLNTNSSQQGEEKRAS